MIWLWVYLGVGAVTAIWLLSESLPDQMRITGFLYWPTIWRDLAYSAILGLVWPCVWAFILMFCVASNTLAKFANSNNYRPELEKK